MAPTLAHMPLDPAVFVHASTVGLPEAAILFAAAGLSVFPCVPSEKRPLTPHGFHDATTEAGRINSWWRRWPEANIGLRTGCGIDVLDVDQHKSHSGFPMLVRLQQAHLLQGWVAAVRSPSGGIHLYYPSPIEHQGSWSRPGAQIDFRGDGGYVVAAPSRISRIEGATAEYRLIATRPDGHPVDAETIRELLTPPHPTTASRTELDSRDVAAKVDRLAGWVANLTEGSRNSGLFWAACRAAQLDTDAETVLVKAAVMAGLDHREAAATVRSAYRTVALTDGTSHPIGAVSYSSLMRGSPCR